MLRIISRRLQSPLPPPEVVTAVGQEMKLVLGQEEVAAGGEVATAITLLQRLPLPQHRAELVAQLLRDHWTIENGVFRVRDVSYDEDRLHGRQIAHGLSMVRNVAINLIRGGGLRLHP